MTSDPDLTRTALPDNNSTRTDDGASRVESGLGSDGGESSGEKDAVCRVQAVLLTTETGDLLRDTIDRRPRDSARPTDGPHGYELLGVLGRGGMGVVYKARNVALNRLEAVKVMSAGEFAGPKALARFRFEAEAAAGLDHPHIVTVYGVGDGPSGPYIAMRFVEGANLGDRPPGSPRQVAELMAKVSRAVEFAHRAGILHRDLKPANILVDGNGEPCVSDFGIARRLDADSALTQSGTPIGTPAYMAPEQARGDANLTVAADVYSLGVVLYRLLTGRVPYAGSVVEVLRQVQEAEGPPEPRWVNPAADPDLEAVCLRCLEKDPADRYPSAGSLAADLERYVRGEAVLARPPGFWDWVRQVAKTRPEPHPHYSWQVLVWFGGLEFAAGVAVYLLARFAGAAAWVWAVNAGLSAAKGAALWWYMVRRFRHLPVTERHSMVIAVGHTTTYLILTAAHVPLSWSESAATSLGMYPAMAACSGLGLFTLGSTNWSRFFPIGMAAIFSALLLAGWPELAPLAYGVGLGGAMWFWAYASKVWFGRPERTGSRVLTSRPSGHPSAPGQQTMTEGSS